MFTLVGPGVTLGSTQGIVLTINSCSWGWRCVWSCSTSDWPCRAAASAGALGLATAIGALTGAAPLGDVSPIVLAAVLAFGAAALLYLVVDELLVEAHEETGTPLLGAMFFLGFILLYVLAELGG